VGTAGGGGAMTAPGTKVPGFQARAGTD
jgi:hypothetical protein